MPVVIFVLHAVALQISWVFLENFSDAESTNALLRVSSITLPAIGLLASFVWHWLRGARRSYQVARWASITALLLWTIVLASV